VFIAIRISANNAMSWCLLLLRDVAALSQPGDAGCRIGALHKLDQIQRVATFSMPVRVPLRAGRCGSSVPCGLPDQDSGLHLGNSEQLN
jgi:hypothetical protein